MDAYSVNAQIPIFPSAAIVIVLIVGISLAVWRPFRAYLFSIFIPIACAIPTMTFTRFERFGPYFNLYDACFIVMLVAVAIEIQRSRMAVKMPLVALIIMAVLCLGFCISYWRYGFSYESLRALRWGINLPFYLFGAYVMMRVDKRHSALLFTLLSGAIVAEAQHVFYVITIPTLQMNVSFSQLRSSMFQIARSESWILAGPYLIRRAIKWPWAQAIVAVLFLVAALTTQTRTLALGLLGGCVLCWMLFIRLDAVRSRKYIAMATCIAVITILFAIPRLNFGGVAMNFRERLLNLTKQGFVDLSSITRKEALNIEFSDWYHGGPLTLILGNGLDYFSQKYSLGREPSGDTIAFGHLGYITYLSQLGILGFLIYAIALPVSVIRRSIGVFRLSSMPASTHLALLAGASFSFSIVAFLFSGHFLMTDILSGTFAGFVFSFKCSRNSYAANK